MADMPVRFLIILRSICKTPCLPLKFSLIYASSSGTGVPLLIAHVDGTAPLYGAAFKKVVGSFFIAVSYKKKDFYVSKPILTGQFRVFAHDSSINAFSAPVMCQYQPNPII